MVSSWCLVDVRWFIVAMMCATVMGQVQNMQCAAENFMAACATGYAQGARIFNPNDVNMKVPVAGFGAKRQDSMEWLPDGFAFSKVCVQ